MLGFKWIHFSKRDPGSVQRGLVRLPLIRCEFSGHVFYTCQITLAIFAEVPLVFNEAPGNIQGNVTGLVVCVPGWPVRRRHLHRAGVTMGYLLGHDAAARYCRHLHNHRWFFYTGCRWLSASVITCVLALTIPQSFTKSCIVREIGKNIFSSVH